MADGNSSPACDAYDADDDDGAANIPLPPPVMQATVEDAMEDDAMNTMSDAVPNALPPSPKPKPVEVETRQVSLTFNGSAGESVMFKLKNTMKFRKAMDHYSAKVQRPVDQLRFLFEGQRLGTEDTPAAVSSFLLSFSLGSSRQVFGRADCSGVAKVTLQGETTHLSTAR